jgi:hypothetical protein
MGWMFTQLVMTLVFLIDDIRRGTFWTLGKITSATGAQFINTENGIPRSTFLSWLGVGLASSLFFSLLYGFGNKYNYQLVKKKIYLKGLPALFKGFKIIHISDIHSGSLRDQKAVQKGIDLIRAQNPDLVLFTGDLVNDRAIEMDPWMDTFGQIKAPYGVFSTLGNHDYGDYVKWESPAAKKQNLDNLKAVHANLGWRLLMNEQVKIEKEGSYIQLVGIENWGAKARFPKYGKMDLAKLRKSLLTRPILTFGRIRFDGDSVGLRYRVHVPFPTYITKWRGKKYERSGKIQRRCLCWWMFLVYGIPF